MIDVILEHLDLMRLVLSDRALYANPPPTRHAIRFALIPRMRRAHRVETTK